MNRFLLWIVLLSFPFAVLGAADSYRISWRSDPSTSAVICWNQVSGEHPEVCFDTVDHGKKAIAYQSRMLPSRTLNYRGMNNHFARLEGLEPDTAYYFVICDSDGVGRRLWFKTAPAEPQPFTFISGGDSRSDPEARREGNKLVARLRPLFVLFGGDYSGSGTAAQWKEWFSDWQLTISEDGRIYPIIATHGNHENADLQMMEHLFDTPHPDQYYSLGIAGDMMRIWVLNSELEYKDPDKISEQNEWIASDLPRYPDVSWKIAAYHRPMRPHTSRKGEGINRIKWWSQLFYDQGVDVIVESDTHMSKHSYPVRPSDEEGSFEGFVRDDENGFVFIGEGSWGAPKRPANDDKPWTMASGSFFQFKWIQAFPDELRIRTVKFDNADSVVPLREQDLFKRPEGMVFWQPESGEVLRLPFDRGHASYTRPTDPEVLLAAGHGWQWSLDGEQWEKAVAPLGYGDRQVVSTIVKGDERPMRAMFRNSFEIAESEKVKRLFFNLLVDDGCIVLLNGKEVLRQNMPKGEINSSSRALKRIVGWRQKKYRPIPVDPEHLKEGKNHIEVQVFQYSEKSSDLIFDLEVLIKR